MCLPTTCANPSCGKTTWWGCGCHIPSVRSQVPRAEDWCTCEPHNPRTPVNAPEGKSCVRLSEEDRREREGRA